MQEQEKFDYYHNDPLINGTLSFLNELKNVSYLIIDDSIPNTIIQRVSEQCPKVKTVLFSEICSLTSDLTAAQHIFCFSLNRDRELVRILSNLGIRNPLSINMDICPKLMAAVDIFNPKPIAMADIFKEYSSVILQPEYINLKKIIDKDIEKYAILSCPRSGSSFLCNLLLKNGLGSPKEHFIGLFLHLMKQRRNYQDGFNCKHFIESIMATGVRNQYFGTKVISHYLEDAWKLASEQEIKFFESLLPLIKFIYLYRSDKVMQAISLYRAYQTKVWHKLREGDISGSKIVYNFDAIEQDYKSIIKQEKLLSKVISLLKEKYKSHVFVLNYEELDCNTNTVINGVAKFLGADHSIKVMSDVKKIHGESEIIMADQFTKDYKKKYSTFPLRKFEWNII